MRLACEPWWSSPREDGLPPGVADDAVASALRSYRSKREDAPLARAPPRWRSGTTASTSEQLAQDTSARTGVAAPRSTSRRSASVARARGCVREVDRRRPTAGGGSSRSHRGNTHFDDPAGRRDRARGVPNNAFAETLHDDRRGTCWRPSRSVDTARQVVGVGSVGTCAPTCCSSTVPEAASPLFLQVK